jgi:hypothetical protein
LIQAVLLAAVNSGNRKTWQILLPVFQFGSNICQNTLRPAAIAVMVTVNGLPEIFCFIERFKVQPFDPGIAIHQADVQLGSKFSIGVGLSPDDGAYLGLGQSDDPPGDAAGTVLKHHALLFVNCSHQIQTIFLLFGQFCTVLHKPDDVSHIPPDILQLFADGGTDRFGAALFALGQPQKVTPGTPAVHYTSPPPPHVQAFFRLSLLFPCTYSTSFPPLLLVFQRAEGCGAVPKYRNFLQSSRMRNFVPNSV